MSVVRPWVEAVLEPAESRLRNALGSLGRPSNDARLDILEAVASRVGGFGLEDFRRVRDCSHAASVAESLEGAEGVLDALTHVALHPAMALALLAVPPADSSERRRTGIYYTDHRLAQFLAAKLAKRMPKRPRFVDPACGSGILLVGLTLACAGTDRTRATHLLRNSVFAADLSHIALRGAFLSLASLTGDVRALETLAGHLLCTDSLTGGAQAWADTASGGFDAVVANPPWEKLKVTRHEFLRSLGDQRHYGADYLHAGEMPGFDSQRRAVVNYIDELGSGLQLQGSGEPDLYKAFVELSFRLARPGGQVGLIVPAGLIRSQGAEKLRVHLIRCGSPLEITILDNRARFFAIDTRFKFLTVTATLGDRGPALGPTSPIRLEHATADETRVHVTGVARIGRSSLRQLRPDLTVPEVRNGREWAIFRRMALRGRPLGDPEGPWKPHIAREIDMTRDRHLFSSRGSADHSPVVEGRMVHQFRYGAKRYVGGTGRRAEWLPQALGMSHVVPQYWFPLSGLRSEIRQRICEDRVGFCDITGQTNERSLLAAVIPTGAVCGNKVPTVVFPQAAAGATDIKFLWLAIANSLPFDWACRRLITTTVNYFVLLGAPFPDLALNGLHARRLASLASELTRIDGSGGERTNLWVVAKIRAEIDARVLAAYGLDPTDLQQMLEDFPLLDRGQPALPGESRSTITRDFVLQVAGDTLGGLSTRTARELAERVGGAESLGSVPYLPSEFRDAALAALRETSGG